MSGLGKSRSKFGSYVDQKGIQHQELLRMKRVSTNVITKACNTSGTSLGDISKRILVEIVNELTGENKKVSDFW
ncbi:MAG: hypothetical protein NAG76_22455 [Candidatus Pristimantibacillus lignocellulolyticus]|uniref:Uncharacterized protein n=1 Tax=Candidatus Pristimantibacillus lignocellulolyticus TaxID=2994561 RepID=A0A9J6ZF91_9BACL|nr:MAG: hypothetical protein NAG76_22455 [Candidatus Pristimantibacillus lignocellulolyticus]